MKLAISAAVGTCCAVVQDIPLRGQARLTGTIPSSIGKLSRLEGFDRDFEEVGGRGAIEESAAQDGLMDGFLTFNDLKPILPESQVEKVEDGSAEAALRTYAGRLSTTATAMSSVAGLLGNTGWSTKLGAVAPQLSFGLMLLGVPSGELATMRQGFKEMHERFDRVDNAILQSKIEVSNLIKASTNAVLALNAFIVLDEEQRQLSNIADKDNLFIEIPNVFSLRDFYEECDSEKEPLEIFRFVYGHICESSSDCGLYESGSVAFTEKNQAHFFTLFSDIVDNNYKDLSKMASYLVGLLQKASFYYAKCEGFRMLQDYLEENSFRIAAVIYNANRIDAAMDIAKTLFDQRYNEMYSYWDVVGRECVQGVSCHLCIKDATKWRDGKMKCGVDPSPPPPKCQPEGTRCFSSCNPPCCHGQTTLTEYSPTVKCKGKKKCMSGKTGVHRVIDPQRNVRATSVALVKDLSVGDTILGLDEHMSPAVCTVQAISRSTKEKMFGNYTSHHAVFDGDTGMVKMYGEKGKKSHQHTYNVLTSCPLGVDESGIGFSGISPFHDEEEEVSWKDYIAVYHAMSDLVKETGDYWFSSASYKKKDFSRIREVQGDFVRAVISCSRGDDTNCDGLEELVADFVEKDLSDDAKARTKKKFPKLGRGAHAARDIVKKHGKKKGEGKGNEGGVRNGNRNGDGKGDVDKNAKHEKGHKKEKKKGKKF